MDIFIFPHTMNAKRDGIEQDPGILKIPLSNYSWVSVAGDCYFPQDFMLKTSHVPVIEFRESSVDFFPAPKVTEPAPPTTLQLRREVNSVYGR